MKPTGGGDHSGFDRLLASELGRGRGLPEEACPRLELLAAWFDHSLPGTGDSNEPDEAAAIEFHLSRCARCQALIADLARAEPEVLYVHPRPATPQRQWHPRWLVPTAAAALVVLAVAITTLRDSAPGPTASVSPSTPSAASSPAAAAPLPARQTESAQRLGALPPPLASPPTASPGNRATAPAPRAAGAKEQRLAADRVELEGARAAADAESRPERAEAPPLQRRVEQLAPPAAEEAKGGTFVTSPVSAPAGSAVGGQKTKVANIASGAGGGVTFAPGGLVGWRYLRPGVLARTDDGGATWRDQSLPEEARLTVIAAVSPLVCWAAGPSGTLLRTTDGHTWQVMTPPVRADVAGLIAHGAARATLFTTDGTRYDTSDAGATWRRR